LIPFETSNIGFHYLRLKIGILLASTVALLGVTSEFGHAQEAPALVIEGGTLIDGLGGEPLEDSVILIENGRFAAIGARGQVTIPTGAEIYDAAGKTILPGFIDGHCHYEHFWAELYLHLGVTTCVSVQTMQNGDWVLAQKRGVELGQIRGPRIWATGQALGVSPKIELEVKDARVWRGYIDVPNAETARAIVRQKKEQGFEAIKLTEFLTPDMIRAITDEAHRLGMGVVTHSWDVIASANAGVDGIEHIWSVGYSSILDLERRNYVATERTEGRLEAEVMAAQYETENYDVVINAMVENGVAWTPSVAKFVRSFSTYADRFWEREQEILGNPDANLPEVVRVITEYTTQKLMEDYSPEDREAARLGFHKSLEFIRRFVEAGGILKEGSDSSRGLGPLLLHEGLAMDVEAGVPPMVAIQAATINPARVFKKDADYGSVEVGKVADLSIIEGNPLEDIWMTQNVKMVVKDGNLVDPALTNYVNPIPELNSWQTLPERIVVEPAALTQGDGPTTLTVLGEGFWPHHQVYVAGKPLETSFVSREELRAVLPPSAVAEAGMYKVTVRSVGEPNPESYPAPLVVGFR
jgi:imidazolonepropionase-like amidohydrolase